MGKTPKKRGEKRRTPSGRVGRMPQPRRSDKLYTLEVFLTEGPVIEAFVERNPVIKRVIEIRGDQTLQALHEAIFAAFDREEEHLYEFQFGEGPDDPDGSQYSAPFMGEESDGDVRVVRLDDLHLEVGQSFGYWFDFGDDWLHQINVTAIAIPEPRARYPRIIERVGQSPPQYPDWDDEDEDEDEPE